MEGREHSGVLLVLNASADPARVEEWDRWYVEEHLPAVLGTGVFHTGSRFRLADGFELPAEATHMAVYETSRPNLPEAMVEMGRKLAPPTRGTATRPPSVRALTATYTKVSSHGDGTGKRANGVVIVLSDCADASREDFFNEWYEHHGAHVLDNMDHYAMTRYVADDPKPWQAKYLGNLRDRIHRPRSGSAGGLGVVLAACPPRKYRRCRRCVSGARAPSTRSVTQRCSRKSTLVPNRSGALSGVRANRSGHPRSR